VAASAPADPTLAVYEARGREWVEQRTVRRPQRAETLAADALDGPIADLGCGPGWHLPLLGLGLAYGIWG
jgi:hypothetical protein